LRFRAEKNNKQRKNIVSTTEVLILAGLFFVSNYIEKNMKVIKWAEMK